MNIEQTNRLVLLFIEDIKKIASEIPLQNYPYLDQDELVSEGICEFIEQVKLRPASEMQTESDLNSVLYVVKEKMVQYVEQ